MTFDLIAVKKVLTPQVTAGKATDGFRVVEARHQALVAADGSGRADGSRHQRSFGPGSRSPRTDSVRPEQRVQAGARRKSGMNLPQNQHLTYE